MDKPQRTTIPRDLGLLHLKTDKRLYTQRLALQGASVDSKIRRQNELFKQCILYWDIRTGFVEDEGNIVVMLVDETLQDGSDISKAENHQVFPYPWTGVTTKMQMLFAQVGRLIQSFRKSIFNSQPDGTTDDRFFDFNSLPPQHNVFPSVEWATKAQLLEEQLLSQLLSVNLPSEAGLVDTGDENTPVVQYILLEEAYRRAALLEIYRVFPIIYLTGSPTPKASCLYQLRTQQKSF